MTADVKTKRDLFIVFAAAAFVMFFMNELQRLVMLDEVWLNTIGVLSYVLPIVAVLKVKPWKPHTTTTRQFISSLFFTFGAVGVVLIFSRYWMEWAKSADPGGEILGKVRPMESPSSSAVMSNVFRMILAPIAEEVVFRLGMLGLLSRITSRHWALLLSSILFAAGHIYGYTLIQMVPVFVIGLLAGVAYLNLGLGFAILFHSIINCWPYVTENFYSSNAFLGTFAVLLFTGLIVFLFRVIRMIKSSSAR